MILSKWSFKSSTILTRSIHPDWFVDRASSEPQTIDTTDLLVRSLLLRQDQPAVILLGHFSPQVQNEHGFAGPEVWHSAVAHFYDVPHLRSV